MNKELFNDCLTRDQIDQRIIEIGKFPQASNEEKELWSKNFKTKLNLDPKYFIGQSIYEHKTFLGKVTEVVIQKKAPRLFFLLNNGDRINVTNIKYKSQFISPLTGEPNFQLISPNHNTIWSRGFYVPLKELKSIYYITEEYKGKRSETFQQKYGVYTTSSLQVPELKEKTRLTNQRKYGVDWFLARGAHYDAVLKTMQTRYGVDNIRHSAEGIAKMIDGKIKKYGVNYNELFGVGFSKIEKQFVATLLLSDIEFSKDLHYSGSSLGQFTFKSTKKVFKFDFYDEEKNIVIEFLGDYFHCNPNHYKADYIHRITKKTAEATWEKDRLRKELVVKELSCKYIEVWEEDWRKTPLEVLNKIQLIINGNSTNKID